MDASQGSSLGWMWRGRRRKECLLLVLLLAFRQTRRAAATWRRMLVPALIVSTALTAGGVTGAAAQEAEPGSYSNAPVGLNFLIAGFAHSEGKLAFDPSLSIADAKSRAETAAVAYVRTLIFGGNQRSSTSLFRIHRSSPKRMSPTCITSGGCQDASIHVFGCR